MVGKINQSKIKDSEYNIKENDHIIMQNNQL